MGPSCEFRILAHLDEGVGVHECQTEVNQNTVGKQSIRNNATKSDPPLLLPVENRKDDMTTFSRLDITRRNFCLSSGKRKVGSSIREST
jgi:hypothetical protein